jgi:hypothetical protein
LRNRAGIYVSIRSVYKCLRSPAAIIFEAARLPSISQLGRRTSELLFYWSLVPVVEQFEDAVSKLS